MRSRIGFDGDGGSFGSFGADPETDLPMVPAPVAPVAAAASSPAATAAQETWDLDMLLAPFLAALESAAASGVVSEFIAIAGEDAGPGRTRFGEEDPDAEDPILDMNFDPELSPDGVDTFAPPERAPTLRNPVMQFGFEDDYATGFGPSGIFGDDGSPHCVKG
jgi:hypothetical protein